MPVITRDIPFIPRRKRPEPGPAPVSAPVLVAATFDLLEVTLTLVFDRAVNTDLIDVSAFTVLDAADSGRAYFAFGSDQPEAESVRLSMADAGPTPPGPSVMNATSLNGIVAEDDDVAWPGATGLALPFP